MSRNRQSYLFITCTKFIGLLSLSILFILGAGVQSLDAQSFDHEKHPRLNFDFKSLSLELGLQPQNLRIDGAATYQVEANVSEADTLILYASRLDISSVSVDGKSADFSLHNDSLLVPVTDSVKAGQQMEIRVRYAGRPQFGLLKNYNGTIWTSQLPRAQRHWLPVVDNPNVDFETEFSIVVPSGYRVWATGQKTGEEVVSVDVMRYRFASEKQVPASALSMAVGQFASDSTSFGNKNISLAIEKPLSDSIDSGQILQSARNYVDKISARLEMDYPYDVLDIFVMDDHTWETKSWGASAVYIYRNRGDIENQLLRGIIGQWFGSYQREGQWSQADAINLYQTLLINELVDGESELAIKDIPDTATATVYENFGPGHWNRWQGAIAEWQTPSVRSSISETMSSVISKLPPVISWQDYADQWYRKTGQPIYDMPALSVREDTVEKVPSDSVKYEVYYTMDEANGQLKLRFSSTQGVYEELTTLKAYEVYPNKTNESEVTFTGAEDSVILNVDPTISSLKLETSNHPNLILNEYKPAPFLIFELRNAKTVEERAEAARKLGHHTENPDLQLAIRDFMNGEQEPRVRAALLSSLADITGGATGTEQTFLEALKSENEQIRNAGLMALQNFKGNESILKRVQSIAANADSFQMFKKATQVLTTIATPEQFGSYVENVTQADTLGERSIFVIQELANMGNVQQAVSRASLFTGEQYRYEIRKRALQILIQHDHTPSDWISRAEELLGSPDPRIRFLTISGLERNTNQEVISYLREYVQDEYDARVYHRIEQVVQ